jgi:arsenate reductase-like glutaredoxin family protein
MSTTNTEQDRITIADIQASGHCVRGARRWFEQHGLDFADFLKNGITIEEFLKSGDGLAEIVVERTVARRSAE